jgi:hypothetical protein
MLCNVTEEEQTNASTWLSLVESDQHLNVYFHQKETDAPWIFHSFSASKYKYINMDGIEGIGGWLASYMLSKPNTYYKCSDPAMATLLGYINQRRVDRIEDFFERTLGAEQQTKS